MSSGASEAKGVGILLSVGIDAVGVGVEGESPVMAGVGYRAKIFRS